MSVTARILSGFDDPAASAGAWENLLAAGPLDEVFLTRAWQRTWWECFGRGTLLLVLGERDGRPAALAPLFADAGMVFPVGSGGSDYLDLVGDPGGPDLLGAMLAAARGAAPGFLGFRFYLVPDDSPTGARLAAAAPALGLRHHDEGHLPAPRLGGGPAALAAAAERGSLRRKENRLRREGNLEVLHLRTASETLPWLETFFAQHEEQWSGTDARSLFSDPRQRDFYHRLVPALAAEGMLRFTVVLWCGEPVTFHCGFCRRGSFLWYKPSYDVRHARRSPGEVLLRHLLLAAAAESAGVFDFGLGDEAFKARFADRTRVVRTHGLYPEAACPSASSA